jgi:sterol desaturase/sphingolipid hydroxylase (fatty acid hydroxylase superfamily)
VRAATPSTGRRPGARRLCQDRGVDGLVYAIPIFFVLMGVEALVNRARFGATRYRLVDSIANLGCGVGQQLLGVFFGVLRVVGYAWVYDRFRLATIPSGSVTAWVALFLGVDLAYYVFHRVSHRVGFMWAAHVVHHQSEEYNLSVALRQSWLDQLVEWIFYTPFALFGFPPAMFAAVSGLNTLYAFWPHTRAIGRLGPFEWIFNTPSAHRVHHAVNPRYIDKNYASMFVIWDRLFGTYEREREEPVFGTLKRLPGTSPLHANVEPWRDLAASARAVRGLRAKLRVWLGPPAATYAAAVESRAPAAAARVPSGPAVAFAAAFALLVAVTVGYLYIASSLAPAARAGVAVCLMAWLVAGAAVLERRRRSSTPLH